MCLCCFPACICFSRIVSRQYLPAGRRTYLVYQFPYLFIVHFVFWLFTCVLILFSALPMCFICFPVSSCFSYICAPNLAGWPMCFILFSGNIAVVLLCFPSSMICSYNLSKRIEALENRKVDVETQITSLSSYGLRHMSDFDKYIR